jgi:hypothetical protein
VGVILATSQRSPLRPSSNQNPNRRNDRCRDPHPPKVAEILVQAGHRCIPTVWGIQHTVRVSHHSVRAHPRTVRAQCAETDAQGAATPGQRATEAFEAVKQAWRRAAEAPQHGEPRWSVEPKDLALTFRRCLQAQPDLISWAIPKQWVQEAYPLLCKAEGVVWPPPYKDFAKELKWLMPRSRDFKQRPTCARDTWSPIPPPPSSNSPPPSGSGPDVSAPTGYPPARVTDQGGLST